MNLNTFFGTPRRTILSVVSAVFVVVFAAVSGKLFEELDSGEYMVIQYPITGELQVFTQPGLQFQGLGTVTKYPRRNEFNFDGKDTQALNLRFYDGGNAALYGTMSWLMPSDPQAILKIHRDFRSAEAFEQQAVRRAMQAAATFSGPTMTSFDSAAGRRNELLTILNDQTLNGVYKTVTKKVLAKDVAGVEKEQTMIEIVRDEKSQPVRAQESYVAEYKVELLPMTITKFVYEDRVEKQIQEQQQATNQVAVAAANAKRADQDAITAEAQGRANAAKAKWEQEVANAKTVAEAQAKITIAEASVKEADAYKRAEILRGQGEAERKRLVMEADGALDKKLEAFVKVNQQYADAIAKAQPGAWAPGIVMGDGGKSGGGDRATALLELLTAKTAKDLSLDMSVKGNQKK